MFPGKGKAVARPSRPCCPTLTSLRVATKLTYAQVTACLGGSGWAEQGVERAWGRWEEEGGAAAARSMNWARGAKGEEANQEVDDDENLKTGERRSSELCNFIFMLCHPCYGVPPSRDIEPSYTTRRTLHSRVNFVTGSVA